MSLNNNIYSSIGDYIYSRKYIGCGSFSKVFKGYHKKTNVRVAIKKISLNGINDPSLIEHIWQEIELMKSLDHPNIVKFYEAIIKKDYVYIIIEYCNSGDISKYITSPCNEKFAKDIIKQVADALKYLNEKKVIHRDLKPKNILLTNNNIVKIADFGFARIIKDEKNELMETLCGTPLYMAPEIVTIKKYTNKSELWSLGIIMYEILTGYHPYKNSKNILDMLEKIKSLKLKFPVYLTPECSDLLSLLLEKDPNKRISWNDFFNHNWIRDQVDMKLYESMSKSSANLEKSQLKNIPLNDTKTKPIDIIKKPNVIETIFPFEEDQSNILTPNDIKEISNMNYFSPPTPTDIDDYIIIEEEISSKISSEPIDIVKKSDNNGSGIFGYLSGSLGKLFNK